MGVTLGGTLFSTFKTIQKSADDIIPLLASSLPGNATFFLTFVALKSDPMHMEFGYSVKNTTSGFIWRSDSLSLPLSENDSLMVIVPGSIFSITDEDHRIELTANNYVKIVGIHLLYKTETKTIEDIVDGHVIDINAY
ncbi:hypothetical protein POM88_053645 [Heracleum sosnowskyi]|uniref:CSC1/OSCA1-like 7TM region domain-containing protein n=1 Tax=Heracleum sosnowskyi TaxID=360622 RepID=A0AAD8LWY0_9APIA|nr:hypothetical protein POM88_053645 [Heracleum sosnowskyi]